MMLLSRWRHVVSSLLAGNQLGQALCSVSPRCPCCIAVSFPVRLFEVYVVPMKRRGRGGCHLQTTEDW